MNEVLDRLPAHLLSLVIDQPYNEYTARDHAVWRYVMRRNVRYLSRVAHGSYLDGLKKTGISIEEIPHMYGMNRILKEIGWAAVAVDGFIPPSAFMEFQAYNVLVIAADIRPVGQIEYTPAPDIIHEAAGHAPIIADPEYAGYLRLFGEIGSKAFSSARDYQLYEAIRHVSILKSDPNSTENAIEEAERQLHEIEQHLGKPSEMSLIRNLHWWTVEYGLIGELNTPRIYGAGLLSSIGESFSALHDTVKKIPYTLEAMHQGFDITTRQPQLFVTPDFAHLTRVLREFESTMALRKGGAESIRKAIDSGNVASCVYSSGLQVSGTLSKLYLNSEDPAYIQATGPVTLNFNSRQLDGHGRERHPHGFGSPVGCIRGIPLPPEKMTRPMLREYGLREGEKCQLEFESGLKLEGIFDSSRHAGGRLLLLSFRECTVEYRGEILFEPAWGMYDMAVGASIISCFSGPADPDAFGLTYPVPSEKTHKIIYSEKDKQLFSLYQNMRDVRERKEKAVVPEGILSRLKEQHPGDWLLPLEIYEVAGKLELHDLKSEAGHYLEEIKISFPDFAHLIDNGLEV